MNVRRHSKNSSVLCGSSHICCDTASSQVMIMMMMLMMMVMMIRGTEASQSRHSARRCERPAPRTTAFFHQWSNWPAGGLYGDFGTGNLSLHSSTGRPVHRFLCSLPICARHRRGRAAGGGHVEKPRRSTLNQIHTSMLQERHDDFRRSASVCEREPSERGPRLPSLPEKHDMLTNPTLSPQEKATQTSAANYGQSPHARAKYERQTVPCQDCSKKCATPRARTRQHASLSHSVACQLAVRTRVSQCS